MGFNKCENMELISLGNNKSKNVLYDGGHKLKVDETIRLS